MEHYREAVEEMPSNMLKPRGRLVKTTGFVDTSHAGDKRTRRSITGYIIFVNKTPIIWFIKNQNTVESSTFSSEFIAMKSCVEHIAALRFKLRMFGIPVNGKADILCAIVRIGWINTNENLADALTKRLPAIKRDYLFGN